MRRSQEQERGCQSWAHQIRNDDYEDRSSSSNMKEPNDDEEYGDLSIEEGELLPRSSLRHSLKDRQPWTKTAKVLAVTNLCLTAILIITWFISANFRCDCLKGPQPPYSPMYEDGAIKYVNKVFSPQKIFQSEPSDEVEAAWNATMGSTEGIVQLPKKVAAKLPETVEFFFEPGYFAYGVSAYHQLHCLNRIRKSFYPDRYFPSESQEEINFHKYHCIDLLRQSIMCNGDASMVYWWNSNYSFLDSNGVKHYTQEYLDRNAQERAQGSFVKWEVETRCHDWDAMNDWVEKNKVDRDSIERFSKQMQESSSEDH